MRFEIGDGGSMTSASCPDRISLLHLGVLACVVSVLAMGCSFSRPTTTPRSAWNQILSTVAIDRALKQLEWPAVQDSTVYVQVGPPGDSLDSDYLRRAVEVALADRGAKIAGELEEADHVLTCLVGAIGLNIGGRYVGIEGTQGGFIPFTIPELMLFKRTKREGFARVEIALIDRMNGGVVHRSGPVEGTTERRSITILFVFGFTRSDTNRLE